ncbi:DNA ligase D [Chryseobacterium sp. VAUSW3]|uniref:DNA ligase D n=1 Tax=Chryseobacterium sp. VAUSW3 TaxID=2010998 RepID=UPI000B4DC945|nr:DNA ligase D [Chryseobacterium sp. VAUSW3]OWR14083.1 DNA ligase D [Chryseobacterium sp. VAUSW3]
MPLEEYNKKRDFTQTAEPEGKAAVGKGKLKFVIQRHAASRLHYDFRLEMDGVLKSWAIPKGPSLNPEDKRLAMMVEDHPFAYRTFEGSIPDGNYGAGEVEIWDEGTYEPLGKVKGKTDDLIMQHELHTGSMKFVLSGKKLKGEFALVKIKNAESGDPWLLIKHRDQFSVDHYDAEENTDPDSKVSAYLQSKKKSSKVSKSSAPEMKSYRNHAPALSGERTLTKFITPMLAGTSAKPFSSPEWAFEIKWDGYRAIADLRKDIQLYSRNGLSYAEKFKKISNSLKFQEHEMILDGELVAYDNEGKPNFQWLQRIGENPNLNIIYQVFDLLWLNGHSTENLSLLQRKELLKDALVETEHIKYHDHILEKGEAFFMQIEKLGLEGMIAKKTDSTYSRGTRNGDWLKIKRQQTEEVLICGFTAPKGSRKKFGSLVLGRYNGNELIFCGHTGTGFSDKMLVELYDKMKPLIVAESPFKKIPKTNDKATWLKPELIAEIKFTEITSDHIFRHPVFLRLREDLNPKDLNFKKDEKTNIPEPKPLKKTTMKRDTDQLQKLGKQEVKLTNHNKIYFPKDGVTKGDVIAYYQSISKYILPHLKDRPQSMNRFPNGIEGMSFYQKDASDEIPDWIETQKVFSESTDKYINYILCNDKATMAYLNNLGCIELNVWTSRKDTTDKPDYLVLDLDPSDNNTFEDVILTAQTVKKIMDKAKVKGYCKTSGSSGIHIYIPAGAKYSFEQVKDFAHVMMQMVQKEIPDITTLERNLQKRDKGKIYLDYLQNRRGQTLASVYSLRPKNGAPVSMPIEWDELKTGLKPTDFNIENALQRIEKKGDIFKPVLGKGFDMLKALELLEKE